MENENISSEIRVGETKYCRNCGAPSDKHDAFCRKCGAPFGNDFPAAGRPSSDSRIVFSWFGLPLFFVLFLLLCVLSYFHDTRYGETDSFDTILGFLVIATIIICSAISIFFAAISNSKYKAVSIGFNIAWSVFLFVLLIVMGIIAEGMA